MSNNFEIVVAISIVKMGKPLVHLIPGQEGVLRDSLRSSKVSTDTNGLEIVMGKGDDVKRSSTSNSNGSAKTSKSNSSNESGLCSFVHSNASSSSSNSSNHINNAMSATHANGPSVVPDSITTSGVIPESNSSKVKIAIQNYEESIEITRQNSIAASVEMKQSSILSSLSRSLKQKTNGVSTRASKKSKELSQDSMKPSPFAGIPQTPEGNSISSSNNIQIPIEEKGENNSQIKGPQKFGDESTITSALTYNSSSFGSAYVANTKDDATITPRFEVLLDEIQEANTETETAESEAAESEEFGRTDYPSPEEVQSVISRIEVLLDESSETEAKQTTGKKSKRKSSSTQEKPVSSSVNPRLFVGSRNQRSTKNQGRHQHQLSTSTRSPATVNTPSSASNQFFSAIDYHVATKRHGVPKLIQKDDSIEVIQPSKSDNAINTSDLNSVLSPSKTKGYRRSPTPTDTLFRMPPSPMGMVEPKKIKKVYSIQEGKLVVNLVDKCEEQEAIELTKNGSLIAEQLAYHAQEQQEECENPSAINAAKSPRKSVTKTPSKPFLPKGFRWKNKLSKNASPKAFLSQKPINVVISDKTGAIELLRTRTNINGKTTFSYDETDEDTVIKQLSPASSPVPQRKNQESPEQNDIAVVVPSSDQEIPPPSFDSMGRIVSIRKISSKDENFGSPPSTPPNKDPTKYHVSPSIMISTSPKMIEPVIEIPSNRVDENNAEMTRAGSCSAKSAALKGTISTASPPSRNSPSRIKSNEHGTIAASTTWTHVLRSGDEPVFVRRERSTPNITIPKIPASKRDTTSKSANAQIPATTSVVKEAGKMSSDSIGTDQLSSEENSRKVNIQVYGVKKADESIKNIEISSVASSESEHESQGNVSALVKKYTKMVVKKPLPAQESDVGQLTPSKTDVSESKHIVHVNVLGVAGIVVDRMKCRDITGDDRSPCPPEQMTAVVGITEYGANSIDSITTFSSELAHAPSTKSKDDGKLHMKTQRHIAVWGSNDNGETPGSVVKSKVLNLNGKKPKLLDLNVALVKSDEGKDHTAVVIGTARIKITPGMIIGKYTKIIDLPVHQVLKEQPSSSRNKNQVLLLRTSSEERNDLRKLRVERTSEKDENSNHKNLTSAYTIDPEGDSMIRIEIRVEKVHTDSEHKSSLENGTAATETSDEISSSSGESSPEQTASAELYSKPVELPSNFGNESIVDNVDCKIDDELDQPGCSIFGKRLGLPTCNANTEEGLAGHIDNSIGDMAERVFSKTCQGTEEDNSSFFAANTLGSQMDTTRQIHPTLLDDIKSALRPVRTLNDLRSLAKEFAMSGGDYFFADNYLMRNQEALVADDMYDSASVGSATLARYEQELREFEDNQCLESWTKKHDDDNVTHSSGESDGDSFSLNRTAFDEENIKLNFDRKRRVVSENNKFEMGNHREAPVETQSFERHPLTASNLDVGCERDDEKTTGDKEEKAALIDDAAEEDKKGDNLKRQSSGKPSSLPSVVENIAEVLSIGGKACGYFSANNVDTTGSTKISIWRMQSAVSEGHIPSSVHNDDAQSVGELTAMTLEKNEIKENSRKLLLARLGLPKDILAWGGSGKANAGNDSGEQDADNDSNDISAQPENYFAEYEEGNNGVRSFYGNESGDVSKQNEDLEKFPIEKEDSPTDISTNGSTGIDNDLKNEKNPHVRLV